MQAVIVNRGGLIETNFLDVRPSSVLVSMFNGEGSQKIGSLAATLDTVSTTVSVTVAKGATSISLADATSVVIGRRYAIGSVYTARAREVVTIKDLTASTATFWGPLNYAHNSGDAFGGTRAYYNVLSTQADALWWDGYSDWVPNTGDVITEVVDCVLRKIPTVIIDETDLLRVFPKMQKIIDAELDLPSTLLEASAEFLRTFGGKNRAHCGLGADHFRRPVALTWWILRRYSLGDAHSAMMDLMEKERDNLIKNLESSIPFDNDQDGVTTGRSDGGYTVITLGRS
jgi:hypothetical protein